MTLTVPIHLAAVPQTPGPIERVAEPVTVGIPFPRGCWRDVTALAMKDADGRAVPLQTRVLDCWPDGSVRWALVDFQADALSNSARYDLLVEATDVPHAVPGPAIAVMTDAGGVTVDTGAARVRLGAGSPFPFEHLSVAGVSVIAPEASGLTIQDASGTMHAVRVERVWIEESGAVRTAIGLAARVTLAHGVLDVTGRVEFFAGSSAARFAVTVGNPRRAQHPRGFWELGDSGSVHLRDVAVTFALPADPLGSQVRCSPERGAPMTAWDTPVELYQESSGGANWRSSTHANRQGVVPHTRQGYRLRAATDDHAGRRATPILSLMRGHRVVTVAMPHFWQNFPKALEATANSITLRLFPAQYPDLYELQGGERKTHRFVAAFGPDAVTENPLEWCRSPLLARAEPAWYCSTGALQHLAPETEDHHLDHRHLVRAAIEGDDTFDRKREAIDEYGWRNFGDLYADHETVGHSGEIPLVSHYNNQYDAIAGFALQFMRSADLRWHGLMNDLAAHVVDIDVYHCDEDKSAYNHGLFWHTCHYVDAGQSTHRSYPQGPGVWGGGPSGEHNYTTGLMLHHFLTGEPQSRKTALGLARWVIDMDDGDLTVFKWLARGGTGLATQAGSMLYHGPGRGAGNSLNALLDGFRLSGDPAWLRKVDDIVRRCIHPDDDIAARDLLDAERRWFYTVFLQALGKYLDHKIERGEIDEMYVYARRSLLHYARWMVDHEYPYLDKPEILEYPNETWAAQDMRKSDVFAYAAMHSSGPERARFTERAEFFFRYSVETLGGMATRTLTRPVVLLLTNGIRYPYLESHKDVCAPAGPDVRTFEMPVVFVPQKRRAKRNAHVAALAAAGAVLSWIVYLWR